jgi:hypothetical protein
MDRSSSKKRVKKKKSTTKPRPKRAKYEAPVEDSPLDDSQFDSQMGTQEY